jgi:hypothetical protein
VTFLKSAGFHLMLWSVGFMLACDDGAPTLSVNPSDAVVEPAVAKPETRPRIVSAKLTPEELTPGETVVLEYEAEATNDAALSEGFLWKWNDRRLDNDGPALDVPDEARRGDTIAVRLVVQSDAETSDEVWRTATVVNTPIEWIDLRLTPEGEVAPGTELTAVAEGRDHDKDAIGYQYQW